jgi:hypothetical protein
MGHACALPGRTPFPLHPSHMVVCRMRAGFPVRSTARTLRSKPGASPPSARRTNAHGPARYRILDCTLHGTVQAPSHHWAAGSSTVRQVHAQYRRPSTAPSTSPYLTSLTLPGVVHRPTALSSSRPPKRAGEKVAVPVPQRPRPIQGR